MNSEESKKGLPEDCVNDEAAVAVIILLQCAKDVLEAGGELVTWPGGVQLQRRGLRVQQDSMPRLRDVRRSHSRHSNFAVNRSLQWRQASWERNGSPN